jgi:hypothetical protein
MKMRELTGLQLVKEGLDKEISLQEPVNLKSFHVNNNFKMKFCR